jgi:hypothetical protein
MIGAESHDSGPDSPDESPETPDEDPEDGYEEEAALELDIDDTDALGDEDPAGSSEIEGFGVDEEREQL